jgi:hypothetical protein
MTEFEKQLEKRVENLNFSVNERKDDEFLIKAIVVNNCPNYILSNGLVDVNRDVVMKLLVIIGNETKIRNVYFFHCYYFLSNGLDLFI